MKNGTRIAVCNPMTPDFNLVRLMIHKGDKFTIPPVCVSDSMQRASNEIYKSTQLANI